jgi:hypothetical protein
MLRSLIALPVLFVLCAHEAAAQQRPRPQYQCGTPPAMDSVTVEGSRWLACDNGYWGSVYLAA